MAPQLWHCHEFANSYVCHCAMVASLIETGETEQKSSVVISCVLNWWYFTGCSGEGVHIKRQKEFTSVRWSATRQFPGWFGSSTGLKNACKKWTVPVRPFRCRLLLDQTCSSLLIHTAVLRLVTSVWEFCFGSSRNPCLRTQAWSSDAERWEGRRENLGCLPCSIYNPCLKGHTWWPDFIVSQNGGFFLGFPKTCVTAQPWSPDTAMWKRTGMLGLHPWIFRSACVMTQPWSPDTARWKRTGMLGLHPSEVHVWWHSLGHLML